MTLRPSPEKTTCSFPSGFSGKSRSLGLVPGNRDPNTAVHFQSLRAQKMIEKTQSRPPGLKMSSEIEIFKRATHQTPSFWWGDSRHCSCDTPCTQHNFMIDQRLPKVRDGETTIKIKFSLFEGGRPWGQRGTSSKTLVFVGNATTIKF